MPMTSSLRAGIARSVVTGCVVAASVLTLATSTRAERTASGLVTVGEVIIDGSGDLDPAVVRHATTTRIAALRSCLTRQLRLDPTAHGRLTVGMTITAAGRTTSIESVEDTVGSTAVAECVARVFRSMVFQPGPIGGSVTARIPLTFSSGL